MDVSGLRAQIPVCQQAAYMNSGWSGPSPNRVVEAVGRWLQRESEEGPASPAMLQAAMTERTKVREAIAGLLNVAPDEICLTQNTTEGINIVLSGLEWHPGDEVVTWSIEHPAVLVPARFLEDRNGVRVRILQLEPDEDHDDVLAKIEAALTPRTRLVFLSHIQYASGLRMPIEALRNLTRPRGIPMLVDGAQAVGEVSVDLRALDVDYYSLSGQKWLLGPDGTGALFVKRPHVATLQPSWTSDRTVRSVSGDGRLELNESIRKFESSTASTALRVGLGEAIAWAQEIGIEAIEARNADLATRAKEGLAGTRGVHLLTPRNPRASAGLVSFRIAAMEARDAVDALWREGRIVARPVDRLAAVRLSLHYFVTEAEVDRAVEIVDRLAQGA